MINKPICEFIRDIANSPKDKIKGLQVKDLFILRSHVQNCDNCNVIIERFCAENPEPEDTDDGGMPTIGFGTN